ncbi:MAG: PQQ-binding-like beta-propeller repeat protein [Planctomycetes bacterium]|nr:PQQ-binding-like beta-propeller repeat protein [Planctomycetota bacterium]
MKCHAALFVVLAGVAAITPFPSTAAACSTVPRRLHRTKVLGVRHEGKHWGSPYDADSKVFLGTDAGDLFIFRHDATPTALPDPVAAAGAANARVARQIRREHRKQVENHVLIRKIELDAPIRSTPSVSDGVLYVNTDKSLYAIGKG